MTARDLPKYLENLKQERFYGDIRLCVKRGAVVRMIVEESILMNDGEPRDVNNNVRQ
jgi:hypothetical protein